MAAAVAGVCVIRIRWWIVQRRRFLARVFELSRILPFYIGIQLLKRHSISRPSMSRWLLLPVPPPHWSFSVREVIRIHRTAQR